jgi:hypothetical protein
MKSHALALVGGAAAVGIAALWLFTTPIFAEPDEQEHLDYALTIADEGLPTRTKGRIVATDSDATLRYLEDKLHYRELRFDSSFRVASSFSSSEARRAIDAKVPEIIRDDRMLRSIPAVAPYYPVGYYLVAAIVYEFAHTVIHLGAIESVYAMRTLGLIALVVTLWAAYRLYIELGFTRPTSAIAITAIGVFPLVGWVSGMIQPDTFTTAGVTVALLITLRIRKQADALSGYAWLTLVIVALSFIKVQYAALTLFGLLPALLAVFLRAPSLRRAGSIVATVTLSLFALAASIALLPHVIVVGAHVTGAMLHDPLSWLGEFNAIFISGAAHTTFWSSRDWFDTNFFPLPHELVAGATAIASALTLVFVFITVGRIALRLAKFSLRHRRLAAAIALSDAPFALYVVWTLGLLIIDLAIPGNLGLLGRYWLPVLVPLLAILMRSVARARFPRQRVRVSTVVAGVWLAYALLAAPFAFAQMHQRFFSAQGPRNPFARRVTVERIWDSQGRKFDTEEITIAYGSKLCFRGVAIDSRYGVLDRGVAVKVDVQLTNLRSGIPRSYPANVFNDDALINIGFEGCIPPRVLTVGHHEARLEVFARDGTALLWPPHLHVTVVRSPRSTGG